MNVLVTGGTGFIGQAVVRHALHDGARVAVLTRSPDTKVVPQGVRVIGGGLVSPDWRTIEEFHPDFCVHCAWVATPGTYLASPENAVLADLSHSLADGLYARGLKKFVGLGTCFEYEASREPLDETAVLSIASLPYVQAKLRVLKSLQSCFENRHAWMRVFYAYGPGEHPKRLTSLAIRTLSHGGILHLHNPDDIVDYIHVEDIASAILVVCHSAACGIFNIGSGQGRPVRAVASLIARLCGHPEGVTWENPEGFQSRVADSGRLRALGWAPRCDFEDSIKAMCLAEATSRGAS